MASSSVHSPTDSPAIAAVRGLFQKTLRVSTKDNRVFLGTFVGTDQLLNLLLVNAEEFLLGTQVNVDPTGRYVGQVMIPWRLITKVEAPVHDGLNERHADNGSLYI